MEVDDYNFCELLRMEPVARMPDEDLLHSEVAIMSGGRDQSGRPLVTFPAQNHGILESRVMGSGLDRILRYYINITSPTTKVHGFAFIADLRFSTLDFISMLKSSLNSLQAETSSAVGPFMLYLIQPIDKKCLKDTQTLLALRQSKKKSNKHIPSTLFQTVMVVDEMDLYNHVDKSQLTADLGGYLQYSHSAWVRFRKTVEPFFVCYEEVIPKLPDAFSRLEDLESYDLGETREDLERQRENMQQLIRDLFRELGLESLSQECDDLLSKINQSDIDEVYAAVAQKPVFREVRLLAEYCREKLTMMKQRLDAARDRVEGRVEDEMKRIDLLEEMQNLSNWLLNEGPTGLKRLEIADSLGRAEMLCNHFETGVASLAVDKLAQADGLKEEFQTLVSEGGNGFANLRSAVRALEGHAENYQSMLDDRRHVLSTVRSFYGLYDKIARWCVRALKFLPSDIVDVHNDIRSERTKSRRRGQDVGDAEYRWIEDSERFLRKHPSPKEEDVTSMMEYVETVGEKVRKKKAKHLANRCAVLLRVLNTNDLASEKDVLLAKKWQGEVVGSRDDSQREKTKGVIRERKDGDGVEEARMEAEEEKREEMESEVDDPLLRRIGRHTPSKEVEVRGQRSKRRSSKGKVEEKADDRKSDSDGRGRKVADEERRTDDGAKEEKEDVRVEKDKDERGKEREQSQWIRPSQDFWAGRIPGVARQSQPQTDETDGRVAQHYDNVGMPVQDVHPHMAGRLQGPDQQVQDVNSPHLTASNAGGFQRYLNRNQNANPSPSYVNGHPLHALHGNVAPLHHQQVGPFQGMPGPINQSHLGTFQTRQSQFPVHGLNQSPYSIPPGSDVASRQHVQVMNTSAQTCTLYDPVTGLPYQAYLQSPRSTSLQGDPRSTDYLSDSQHSTPGLGHHRGQRLVDPHISGMHALQALVGHPQHRVTGHNRTHALNIGLSSMQAQHSRASTPRSEHKRELSPYEDVLSRIGQMRTRARRGKNGHDKSKPTSREMRAAKSVPNLSNLLAGVHMDGAGNRYGDTGLDLEGDRQSDYYARLAHLDDQTGRCSSEHATKKWVSRLMADDLHYANSSSLRSASPALPSSNTPRNQPRPLTPQEKYELESLTSLLNESDDDDDDSAPVSNSPTRDRFRLGDISSSQTRSRVLPTRPPNIDFDADQRELDQIRQNLSGSFAAPGNSEFGVTFDPLQTNELSPNLHHSSLSSNEISPLHYPSSHSTQTHPHPTSQSSHATYNSAYHSSASFAGANQGGSSYTSHHQNQTGPFNGRGVPSSRLPSGGAEGTTLAPMTEQMREYFGEVGVTEEELVQQGLEERLRNVHVNQVQERATRDHLSTPNFLAEAMNTLVKLDSSADSQLPVGLPLGARHMLQRNPSLQLSDEGVIIDGASWDGTLEPGSVATTERGSVESGVGSRGQASNP
ncbi:uncharacterized protein LOC100890776 [Strongylocentrotus purpuratus]|uniref:CRAL-TRIO domain-containing protein n=1 Tax=Strongylocentrotus purpuratus TaxID=7668 RepID=A0A7M7LSH8_STRPU|nr:uncharacterized protein LOC100890776 [Strongylocentrotus purpuratus]